MFRIVTLQTKLDKFHLDENDDSWYYCNVLKFIFTSINFYEIRDTLFHFNLVLPMLLVPNYEIYKTIKNL